LSLALARKYRPATFNDLIGQEAVSQTLSLALDNQRLSHAYLFSGLRGSGKTSTARIFAKALLCEKGASSHPCGECTHCIMAAENRHMDIIEMDAASNRGIDDIKDLIEHTKYKPSSARYKIFIIDEVHMLTSEAAAALLKTLEEPVEHVLFILATTELHKVLSTIASRCQVYRFRRARTDELKGRLQYILKKEERRADDDALQLIIDRSEGCYRDAESLLGQMLTLQDKEVTCSELTSFLGLPPPELLERFLRALISGYAMPAVEVADESFSAGVDPEQFLKESIRSARDEAVRAAQSKPLTWADGEESVAERLPQIIRVLLQALQDLAYVPQPMIAVHLAILTVCTKKEERPAFAKASSYAKTSEDKPADKPAVSSSNEEAAVSPARVSELSVERVRSVWKRLVEEVKSTNQVASTFLRAVEPVAMAGDTVTIRAQYSLHCTFFEKPENRKLLAETLSGLLKQQVAVSFVLDESGVHKGPSLAEQRRVQEDKFERTVKEVFGA